MLGLDTQDVTSDALAFMRRYRMATRRCATGPTPPSGPGSSTGVPESFLIDRQGRIALHITGPIGSGQEGQVVSRLEALL